MTNGKLREVRFVDGVACYECTCCLRWMPIATGFYRCNNPEVKSGRRSHCIICEKKKYKTQPRRQEYQHAYYMARRETWNKKRDAKRAARLGASSTIAI